MSHPVEEKQTDNKQKTKWVSLRNVNNDRAKKGDAVTRKPKERSDKTPKTPAQR